MVASRNIAGSALATPTIATTSAIARMRHFTPEA
jgi:hypothetical protein